MLPSNTPTSMRSTKWSPIKKITVTRSSPSGGTATKGCIPPPLHFDIIDGKIWIQQDQTDYGIANDLVDMGVPKSDIVLGYLSRKKREEMDLQKLEIQAVVLSPIPVRRKSSRSE